MSLYNVLQGPEEVCTRCNSHIRRRIQFKYGSTRQNSYKLGDRLLWGANDVGEPNRHLVVVDGAGEDCQVCGYAPHIKDYEVLVRDDVVESVKPSSGLFPFDGVITFVVLEE